MVLKKMHFDSRFTMCSAVRSLSFAWAVLCRAELCCAELCCATLCLSFAVLCCSALCMLYCAWCAVQCMLLRTLNVQSYCTELAGKFYTWHMLILVGMAMHTFQGYNKKKLAHQVMYRLGLTSKGGKPCQRRPCFWREAGSRQNSQRCSTAQAAS